jgi:hypothetical protein
MQTGLLHRRRRGRRQAGDAHRHLRANRAELLGAFASGAGASAIEALRAYSKAIRSHFALETGTFFPARHGLRSEFSRNLDTLDREHEALLARLERIEARLVASALPSSADAIDDFNADPAQHERREEALMAWITGDVPGDAADIDANAPSI